MVAAEDAGIRSTSIGDAIRMTSTQPPEGSSFVMNYDADIRPAAQIGSDGRVSNIVVDAPVVTVGFYPTLLP